MPNFHLACYSWVVLCSRDLCVTGSCYGPGDELILNGTHVDRKQEGLYIYLDLKLQKSLSISDAGWKGCCCLLVQRPAIGILRLCEAYYWPSIVFYVFDLDRKSAADHPD